MTAKISIAMASYNGGRYLERQLDSFSAQTRLPDELVICDDGSTDETAAIVADFAARAAFVVCFVRNDERLGYNRNFAKAIDQCTGDIIFISDQDDEWYAEKIATVAALLERHTRALAVVNDQIIAKSSGEVTATTVLGNIRRLGYSDDLFGPGCCTAIRRPLLEIVAPFPGDAVPYDHWVNIIPALLGARLICETPLQLYRRHDTNTSGSVFAAEAASAWTLVKFGRGDDARPAYAARIAANGAIASRLRKRRETIAALGMADRIDEALNALNEETAAYASRLACLNRGRLQRIPQVARMLQDGTYRRFQGYKSAAKDLIAR